MPLLRPKTLCIPLLFIASAMVPLPSKAFFSEDVNQAMDQANACNQTQQNQVYVECMQRNNAQIRATILAKSKQQKYGPKKRQTIKQNIDKRIKSNIKQCLNERALSGDSIIGDRRLAYCSYENMLELLINVERNIEIYF